VGIVKTSFSCLENRLGLLIDLFAVEGDMVIEVVVYLNASHTINNFYVSSSISLYYQSLKTPSVAHINSKNQN